MRGKNPFVVGFMIIATVGVGTAIHLIKPHGYKVVSLGTFGGRYTRANAINDAGQVVGVSEGKGMTCHAFLWVRGKMIRLSGPDILCSEANDINEAGEIVGMQVDARGRVQAVLWKEGQCLTLGTLGGKDSIAHAI